MNKFMRNAMNAIKQYVLQFVIFFAMVILLNIEIAKPIKENVYLSIFISSVVYTTIMMILNLTWMVFGYAIGYALTNDKKGALAFMGFTFIIIQWIVLYLLGLIAWFPGFTLLTAALETSITLFMNWLTRGVENEANRKAD